MMVALHLKGPILNGANCSEKMLIIKMDGFTGVRAVLFQRRSNALIFCQCIGDRSDIPTYIKKEFTLSINQKEESPPMI